MTSYKYDVVYSTKFKKALKKLIKYGKDINELFDIIDKLANDEKLNMKYKNHSLVNDKYYKDCNECHINPDWLLIYRYNKDKLLLLLIDTGSYSELFK